VEWLAKKVGYTGQYFRLIRSGKRPVTAEVARRVSAFLELPIESLFVRDDSSKRDDSPSIQEAAD
jgi:transcriptional regulator with XRE-family HTH domain